MYVLSCSLNMNIMRPSMDLISDHDGIIKFNLELGMETLCNKSKQVLLLS